MSTKNDTKESKIVIKRLEVVAAGHHGGSWKIAYADFVTAMMAFFLVMWLINATTEEQRKGISSYFNPIATQLDTPPPMVSVMPPQPMPLATTQPPAVVTAQQPSAPEPTRTSSEQQTDEAHSQRVVVLRDEHPQPGQSPQSFARASNAAAALNGGTVGAGIREALTADPETRSLSSQVSVSEGDDGLHIQIADSDHAPMFRLGSAQPNAYAAVLLAKIVPFLDPLPGTLSIAGYTDAAPFRAGEPGNWVLSSERAVAVRDVLVRAGFPDWRLRSVTGHADRELFDAAHPLDAANRRIVLILSPKKPQ